MTKAILFFALLAAPAFAQDEGAGLSGGETPPGEAPPAEAPPAEATPAEPISTDQPQENAGDEGINLTLQDRIKAVSRKTFLKTGRFELTPYGGLTINDAFYRRWALGGRAAWYLTDSFAIDAGGAATFDQILDPVVTLRKEQSAVPDEHHLFGYADVGLNFTPIYGKVAALSEWIIHFDAFVTAALGATIDTSPFPFDPNSNFPGFHPAMEVGVGARVFLLKWLVVRTEIRDYIYPQDRSDISKLQNLMMFNLGVGFFFPFDFDYKYEAFKVVG